MEPEDRNENASAGTPEKAPRAPRKSPARRSAPGSAAAKAKRATAPRKPAARRKKAASSSARKSKGFEGMLRGFADRAGRAGASISTMSGEGMKSARRAIGEAGSASKSTIDRITREWRKMDAKKRAQFVAALLGALAAASAPIVRSKMKKR